MTKPAEKLWKFIEETAKRADEMPAWMKGGTSERETKAAMTIQDFTAQCERTWNSASERSVDQLVNAAMGLAGESGEVLEHVKKFRFHGKALDDAAIQLELGDVLHYWVTIVRICGWSVEEIMERNVAKLRQRYPEGFVEVGRD